jgi:uncharacterized membrane protein (DUF485 family)
MFLLLIGIAISILSGAGSQHHDLGASIAYLGSVGLFVCSFFMCCCSGYEGDRITDMVSKLALPLQLLMLTVYLVLPFFTPWWIIAFAPGFLNTMHRLATVYTYREWPAPGTVALISALVGAWLFLVGIGGLTG